MIVATDDTPEIAYNQQMMRNYFFHWVAAALTMVLIGTAGSAYATTEGLPASATSWLAEPLVRVGSGTFTKLGFRIYNATLWAPSGIWNPHRPYALQLRYTRSLSKETLVDATMAAIRDQQHQDEATLARWEQKLQTLLPAIHEGDEMVGLAIPGKQSVLFFNGKPIAELKDGEFSTAFFGIWLGKEANAELREALLGHDR